MSWMKKRGPNTTPSPNSMQPPPPVPMYNPNQHNSQENQWQNQTTNPNWYNPQQQPQPPQQQQQYQENSVSANYWQQPALPSQQQPNQTYPQSTAPAFNQNFGQYQDSASFFNNTNYQQQPQHQTQQNYANLQYNQQYSQNYAPPPAQQPQQQPESADSWGNWGWGDEDNSNVQNTAPAQNLVEAEPDNAWNWSVEDAKKDEEMFPKVKLPKQQSMDEPMQKPVNSHLRNVRGKLETPQWSTESQMSQESSDHTSESDRMISRSSTISHSPISGHDMLPTPNELEENNVQKEEAEANQEIVSNFAGGEDLPPGKGSKKFRQPPLDSRRTVGSSYQQHNQVNLETVPDNAEQPDLPMPKNWPENNEAPINDRNQYLETGQLSDNNDYRSNRSDNDSLPPPGLRRMVLGQMEQNETNSVNTADDPPPPGLSRMVLGQTEASASSQEPPAGLRRMIPGESSSPESSLRQEQEFEASQPRSATIGADTPPALNQKLATSGASGNQNRSEAVGGDMPGSSQDNSNRLGAIGVSSGDIENEGDDLTNSVRNLANSVRNLTVGENLTDGQTSNNSLQDSRRHSHNSRQESSEESDRELKKLARPRDKRSAERKRDAERSRQHKERDYSPDNYKDKKYERRRYNKRYDDDTDYYSDKEKERRRGGEDRDRDYERKYSSLRKDKEKDRRRKDYRRNEYYYRYEDEDRNRGGDSRPSSRSDSMHESYRDRNERDHRDRRSHRDRDRDRERERERYRRHRGDNRDYNHYQGYSYDPYNPYYQYQYYENLRRTNPQAYAEWYRKYYQQAASQSSAYGGEDRASVHSGRSSANDESKDRYTRQSFYSQASFSQLGGYYMGDQSLNMSGQYSVGIDNNSYTRANHYYQPPTDASLNLEDTNRPALRLTPEKFSTAHLKVSISSGKLLKIPSNYVLDGQSATVEILNLQSLLMNDDEFKELNTFPGPLVKGLTHKKTIIEYCENKIRCATGDIVDCDSYILMWELLILLIRQNGMVVGTDIAELLLKNHDSSSMPRPPSVQSNLSGKSNVGENLSEVNSAEIATGGCLKEEEVANKFRDYLLYGSCKEALEWAMKHGLWGHALFLASKLDKRTYANVMMRFANGLTLNDPLQTLYQLLSGKMPAAVACVADEKWGDWRPHLAMILSNSTQRPDLNCRAITALGDTLFSRGSLYAAQFCYLMAQVGFGPFDSPETKLVLLGADHTKGYPLFATNEAIHMTEIYEYACSLNDVNFIIPDFQVYKYILATRLADRGLLEKSLQYLEKVAKYIVANPSSLGAQVVDNVCNLADRLKFYDPVGDADVDESEFGGILETSRPDNSWLKDLRAVQSDYQSGVITHHQQPASFHATTTSTLDPSGAAAACYEQESYQQYGQQLPQQQQQFEDYQNLQDYNNSQQPVQEYQNDYQQSQQSYWDLSLQQQQQQWSAGNEANNYQQQDQQTDYYSNNAQSEDFSPHHQPQQTDGQNAPAHTQPQISMPNQSRGKSIFDEDQPLAHEKSNAAQKAGQNAAKAQLDKPASTGWFGGIFSKLSIKPKNQMKLPDDKNPKIVWDQDKQRWVNMDEEENGGGADFKPPPKMSDLMPKPTAMAPPAGAITNHNMQPFQPNNNNLGFAPAAADNDNNNDIGKPPIPQPNMFKLQRGRNLKKSYVDVFNPNGKSEGGGAKSAVPDQFVAQNATATPQMNFFIPQPVNDPNAPMDFLTPAPPLQFNEQAN